MKLTKILLIVVGLIVLYFVLKKIGVVKFDLQCALDPKCSKGVQVGTEDHANARGTYSVLKKDKDEPCVCQGYFIGNMSPGKCRKQCKKAINFNF